MSGYRLAPSILTADFARLGEEVRVVEGAGAHLIHLDVMDGHFVDNLSMGPAVAEALKRSTRLPLDVHLMVERPDRFLEAFARAGASRIAVHIECRSDVRSCLRWLHERGLQAGLALNPDTSAERVVELIPDADMILVMTVHPGFGGQQFIARALEKIPPIRAASARQRRTADLDVMVDGGIGPKTLPLALEAGANEFVAGNAIFGRPDRAQAVRELLELLPRR